MANKARGDDECSKSIVVISEVISADMDHGMITFQIRKPDGGRGVLCASPNVVIDGIGKAQRALTGRILPWPRKVTA